MYNSLNIANTGMDVSQTWLDAISDNIANINTVRPTSEAAYQTRYVQVAAVNGTVASGPGAAEAAIGNGTQVTGIAFSSAQGVLQYDPQNPMADAQGMVRGNQVDLGQQMSYMILAQRGFQANVQSVKAAQEAYQAALGLKV
jgi:flagellar basal-body rod protein FlgC